MVGFLRDDSAVIRKAFRSVVALSRAPLSGIVVLLGVSLGTSVIAGDRPGVDPQGGTAAGRIEAADARSLATAVRPPVFRLGDAAKPFGWATAIGDFDRDGTPDVAVPDHIGRFNGAYAYRIAFSLSGRQGDDVTFESNADAITIRTVDIDHDNDLDIVVDRPLGGDAVGVWINDGTGHFTAADLRVLPAALKAGDALTPTDAPGDGAASESPAPRPEIAPPSALNTLASDGGGGAIASVANDDHVAAIVSLARPRAPPPPFIS